MTREELQRIIDSEPYDFLRTDPHLGKHLMFLTIGGSHAYGTNVEGSDVDIRGVALNSKEDLLGLGEFEHRVDTATDTTVFSFNKAAKLLCSGNPNVKPYIPCGEKRFNKIVMNVIRLYHMLFDILEKGEINTYRGAEHDILMQIRNGDYDYEELRKHTIPIYEARLQADKKETELPDRVDMKQVNELVMAINEQALKVV